MGSSVVDGTSPRLAGQISDWNIENNTSLTRIDIRSVIVSCIVDREVSIMDESRLAGSKLQLVVFRT